MLPSSDMNGNVPVRSLYIVPVCLSANAAKQYKFEFSIMFDHVRIKSEWYLWSRRFLNSNHLRGQPPCLLLPANLFGIEKSSDRQRQCSVPRHQNEEKNLRTNTA